MTIKCKLIEIGNDQRAIITIGEEVRNKCSVQQTKVVSSINYHAKRFRAGGKLYDFSEGAARG